MSAAASVNAPTLPGLQILHGLNRGRVCTTRPSTPVRTQIARTIAPVNATRGVAAPPVASTFRLARIPSTLEPGHQCLWA